MPVQSNNKRHLLQRNDKKDSHRKQRDQTIVKYFHVPKKNRAKKKVHHKAISAKFTTVQIEAELTELETEDPKDRDEETEVFSTYYIPNNERSVSKKKNPYKTWKKAHNLENSFANDFISALKSELKSQHSTEATSESEDSLLIEKEKETDYQKLVPTTEDIKPVSEDSIMVKKEQEIFESQEGLLNTRDASRLNDVPLENYDEQDNEYDRSRVIEMPNLGETDSYVRIKKDVNNVSFENKTMPSINSNKKRDLSRKMDEFTKFIEKFKEEKSSYTEFITPINGDSENFNYDTTSEIHNTNDDDYFSSSYSYNDANEENTTEMLKSYSMTEFRNDNYFQNFEERLNYNTTADNVLNFLNNSNSPENVSEKDEQSINNRSMKLIKTFEENTTYRTMKYTDIMVSTEDDSNYDLAKTDSNLAKDFEYPLLKRKSSTNKTYSTDAKYLKMFEDEITQTSNIAHNVNEEEMDESASAEYQYTLKHDEKGEKFAEITEKTEDNYKGIKHSTIKLRIFTIWVTFGVLFCILLTVVAIYLTRKNAILEHRPLFEREKEFIWGDGVEERKNYAHHRFSYKEELKKFIGIPADTDSENKEAKSPRATIIKIEQLKHYLPSISTENEWLNTYEKHKKKQERRNWFHRFLESSCVQSIVQIFKRVKVEKTEGKRGGKKNAYDTDTSKNFLKSLWKPAPLKKTKKKETQQFEFLSENLKTFFSDDEMSSEDELLNGKGIHLIDLTQKRNDLKEHNIPEDLLDPSSQHKHMDIISKKYKTTMNEHQKTDNVKNEVERISGYPSKDNSCSFLNEIKKAVGVAEKNITFPEPLPLCSTELLWKPS
ncbi:hypothetical protein HNY73_008992 [Argiope bruennichi]|uniref:Uncharacterized protein n=1 Tax=Argiope bruennichi TaxID=94029 RepID=A0A8T0FDL2_ARGBR|nr:hypothetical protein HNY73_008992 [Argiope bruennichi]